MTLSIIQASNSIYNIQSNNIANTKIVYGSTTPTNFNTGNIIAATIDFGVTFATPPLVVVTLQTDDGTSGAGDGLISVWLRTATTTTQCFTAAANESGRNHGNAKFNWIAIGTLA